MGTILVCTCKSPFQDKLYGVNHRYFNQCKEANNYRCSVCKKEQKVSSKTIIEEKEKKKK
jgi:hypothetical protein